MATKAHCAFCFESLNAHFEQRRPLSLAEVERLWEQYGIGEDPASINGEDEPSVGGASEREDYEDHKIIDAERDGSQDTKAAAISQLLNREHNDSAESSNASLPSSRSTSSRGQTSESIGTSGNTTPASSRTSLNSRSSLFSFRLSRRETQEEHPLFVTWNTYSASNGKTLRGCIGTFEPQELQQGLRTYALTSALEDVRFSPIPPSLLPYLSNHVTLLTNFSQPTKDPLDWTLGKHGIRISFKINQRRYGATYLPDVAKEQGWSRKDTIASLMKKAGWTGKDRPWDVVKAAWEASGGELVRYEGKQVGLDYAEWRAWRDWVNELGSKTQALN